MKNKASLVLMEQLVMILVFALAGVLCLRAFVWSDQTSRELLLREEAVVLCQNSAQTLKAQGSLSAGAQALGAAPEGDIWVLRTGSLRLELREIPGTLPGLGKAELQVFSENTGDSLILLTTGWQEVLP